ncbi:NmrA family transcriptional regulator [Tistrella bauzanensis]|uniref:NmrA family transcriptional regulator n=1 Tax=Tistrella bauzanensis TaxID=657419 RepID=A0ABQ1IE01_9PROT|nr:NmrA/HSCARG family protein [Tistrella bauzanensis]GGB36874.1 NmrA family transcriptional regulator [Tistrella bauzanensis]
MMDEKSVLVFGATGQQGGAVARALRSAGWHVRALVREPAGETAKALEAIGVALHKGDFSDVASIDAAMSGAYGVFSVQPSSGQGAAYGITDAEEVRYGKTVADMAAKHRVRHLVYTSGGAAGKGETGLGHFDSKTEIEGHIRGLPIRSTIVRPAAFMEMLMLPGMGLDQGTFSFFMRPDQSMQFIAADDIGKIVALIFADPERFAGRTIEIAGDEVTGRGIQEVLSRAAGRTITYNRFPDSLLEQDAFLGRLAALVDDGRCAGAADIDALRRDFGTLTTLDAWLSGRGKRLFDAALQAQDAPVALR